MFALMILVFVTNNRFLLSHNDGAWSTEGDGSARSPIRYKARLFQRGEEGEPVQVPIEVVAFHLPRARRIGFHALVNGGR